MKSAVFLYIIQITSFESLKLTPSELLGYIIKLGKHLSAANPKEFIVKNIVRITYKMANDAILFTYNNSDDLEDDNKYETKRLSLVRSFSTTSLKLDEELHGLTQKIVESLNEFVKENVDVEDDDGTSDDLAIDHIHQKYIYI